jgi:2'-5' RNA ligase
LPVERAGYWMHNRIVWVGPDAISPSLEHLVRTLKARLTAENFTIERRAFAAHVSVIRKARAPSDFPPLPAVHWPVDELVLVRSELSAGGSRYEVLQRYALT